MEISAWCEGEGRSLLLLSQLSSLVLVRLCGRGLAAGPFCHRAIAIGTGIVRLQPDGGVVVGDRREIFFLCVVGIAAIAIRHRILWIQLDSRAVIRDRLIVFG